MKSAQNFQLSTVYHIYLQILRKRTATSSQLHFQNSIICIVKIITDVSTLVVPASNWLLVKIPKKASLFVYKTCIKTSFDNNKKSYLYSLEESQQTKCTS